MLGGIVAIPTQEEIEGLGVHASAGWGAEVVDDALAGGVGVAPPDDAEGGEEGWVNVVGGRQGAGECGGGWGERRGGTLNGKGGERFRVIGG